MYLDLVVAGDDVLQFLQLVDDGWDLREHVERENEIPYLHTQSQLCGETPQLVVPAQRN